MAITAVDLAYLDAAVQLAAGGLYTATPNPRVGCLIVKNGVVVGRGFHLRTGGPHAEAAALTAAGAAAAGATAYESLEPCAHHGRTPPCADALIAAGVARVVSAHHDPDPRVAGKGLARIRAAGIASDVIDLDAARAMNVGYFRRTETGRPWVRVKLGASLDGRTAMASGESQWITGAAARADVQAFRARSCAVLTGAGTVLADDPRLTVRDPRYRVDGEIRQPLRVVADSGCRTPAKARLLGEPGKVLIATAGPTGALPPADVIALADAAGRVDLDALLLELGRRGVNELLVEAGPRLTGSILQRAVWDELLVYLAPRLLGSSARPMADMTLERLSDSIDGHIVDVQPIGEDLRLRLQSKARRH